MYGYGFFTIQYMYDDMIPAAHTTDLRWFQNPAPIPTHELLSAARRNFLAG
jgi:hypothetical protein